MASVERRVGDCKCLGCQQVLAKAKCTKCGLQSVARPSALLAVFALLFLARVLLDLHLVPDLALTLSGFALGVYFGRQVAL